MKNSFERDIASEQSALGDSPALAFDYVIRVVDSPLQVDPLAWNTLLQCQAHPTPFMRHEFLAALHVSGCASDTTGWSPRLFLLEHDGVLQAASVLYVKSHSQGEYVFDWAWARAYQQHGLDYHPKALSTVPFVPVSGSRLLARSDPLRLHLARGLLQWCTDQRLSGLHYLFASDEDLTVLLQVGLLPRQGVQFHWTNRQPGYRSFDDFLASLSQDKRKKIRQERRKVQDAGVRFRILQGTQITTKDWDFFYRCYLQTYQTYGSQPYLNREFFACLQRDLPHDWVLFIADQQGQPIASSLVAINASDTGHRAQNDQNFFATAPAQSMARDESSGARPTGARARVAYGRHWGSLSAVDCLHFEACHYQPLQWCIENGYQCFEGGAQGEHKLARALLPVTTTSVHWLAQPQFFAAIDRYLQAERRGIDDYVNVLNEHSPFKASGA